MNAILILTALWAWALAGFIVVALIPIGRGQKIHPIHAQVIILCVLMTFWGCLEMTGNGLHGMAYLN